VAHGLDFLASPMRRRLLFGVLYFSEGAPIGFLWLALPTQLRSAGVPLEEITWLTAVLVLPWTFKFLWAPLIDVLQAPRWRLKHWIVACQWLMALCLLPLLWIDPVENFRVIAGFLLAHAFFAASQDVAIDALCIAETRPEERGEYNGWMHTGMLLGRALMGGGALVLAHSMGNQGVAGLLIGLLLACSFVVLFTRQRSDFHPEGRLREVYAKVRVALVSHHTWLGMAFGLLGGAVYKALEVVYGPMLIDRGYLKSEIGWFSAFPMIGSMIAGTLVGGVLADRLHRVQAVATAMLFLVGGVVTLALLDQVFDHQRGLHLLGCLVMVAFGIGFFTSASYALFMDLTDPRIGATQFSAYMGATNGCESWSVYAIGLLVPALGYGGGFLVMAGVSTAALGLLWALWRRLPKPEVEPSEFRLEEDS